LKLKTLFEGSLLSGPFSFGGVVKKRKYRITEFALRERRIRLIGGVTVSVLAREIRKPRQWIALREIGNTLMTKGEFEFLIAGIRRVAERRLELLRLEVSRETKNASARESL
jgi:hypothetical protein